MSEELYNGGEVIGYRPDLRYIKDNGNVSVTSGNTLSSGHTLSSYTNTVDNFTDNNPSTGIEALNTVESTIDSIIDRLTNLYNSGDVSGEYSDINALLDAYTSGDASYIEKFVDYNKTDISRSTIPEIINTLCEIKERANTIKKTLKKLFFGFETLTDEEINDKCIDFVNTIKAYEDNGTIEKINYMTIYYDSLLCKAVSSCAYAVNRSVYSLQDCCYVSDDTAVDLSKTTIVGSIFEEVSKDIDELTNFNNTYQTVEITNKSLYNYYNKRTELLEASNIASQDVELSTYISSKVSMYADETANAVNNYTKSELGNQSYLNKLSELYTEKQRIRSIYSNSIYK